jgi:hypothetical protein
MVNARKSKLAKQGKGKKDKPKSKNRPKINQNRNKALNRIGKDLDKSGKLAAEQFDLSPLGRLDEGRGDEQTALLDRLQAEMNAPQRSDAMADFLARAQDASSGYSSQELEGLREQRRREIERGQQSGRASLERGQNNYRTGATQRAAQLFELSKNYGQQSADAENDLFVRGADEQYKRLGDYGNTLTSIEKGEYDREQAGMAGYRDYLGKLQQDQENAQKFNLEQELRDRDLQASSKMGIMGILDSRKNAKQQNKIMKDQINADKEARIKVGAPKTNVNYNYNQTSTPSNIPTDIDDRLTASGLAS